MTMSAEIISYLEGLGLSKDVASKERLFSTGVLDSIDIVGLLVFIEKTYNVNFSPFDIGLQDFDTVDLIISVIEKNRVERD
ncbi:hypothetical protein [Cellvibrio sp.]|uniref:hypothetical protein n=1 Tax=Cellvibrio sp. TaxID=1965322 RepID=UPI003964826E